jgi:hypothetical protein
MASGQPKQTLRETAIGRRYTVQLVAAMVLYCATLVATTTILKGHHFSPAVRALIAVIPAIPVFGVIAAVVRFMLSVDELQRQIHLEALAIAAGVTAALAITYTFLEGAGLPHSQAWWAFVCVDVVWGLSLPFVKRRYA